MFDIGWTELLVIAIAAIVVIGPKDLPRVMRLVGQWTGKLKRMAGEFQGQFNEALREAELEDVRKDVVAIGKGLKEEVAKTGADINKGLEVSAPSAPAAAASPTIAPPTAATPDEAEPASATPPAVETPAPAEAVPPAAGTPEPAAAAAGEVKP